MSVEYHISLDQQPLGLKDIVMQYPGPLLKIIGGSGSMSTDQILDFTLYLQGAICKTPVVLDSGGTRSGVCAAVGALASIQHHILSVGWVPSIAQDEGLIDPRYNHLVVINDENWGGDLDPYFTFLEDIQQAGKQVLFLMYHGGKIALKEAERAVKEGYRLFVVSPSGGSAEEFALEHQNLVLPRNNPGILHSILQSF